MSWSTECCGPRESRIPRPLVRRIFLQAGDKVNLRQCSTGEQCVVDIAAIDRHDRAGVQSEGIGHLDVTAFGFGDQHVARQVIVVVQQDVGLDAAFGSAKLGPREHRQAQRNRGRVQREQLVLETELLLALSQPFFISESIARAVKNRSSYNWAGRCSLAYDRVDLLGALAIPRCTSLPRQQPRPLQISRRESA